MKIEDQDIINLIDGLLDESEAERIASGIANSAELQESYATYKLIKEATNFDAEQELKKNLNDWKSELPQQEKPVIPLTPNKNKSLYRYLGVAATLTAICAVFFLLRPSGNTGQQLFAAYYSEPFPNISRSSEDLKLSKDYSQALDHYSSSELSKAIQSFQAMEKSDNRYQESRLLLLDCLIRHEPPLEISDLTNDILLSDSFTREQKDQVEWMSLLYYIRIEDKDNTLEAIEEMQKKSNHLYELRLDELMQDME